MSESYSPHVEQYSSIDTKNRDNFERDAELIRRWYPGDADRIIYDVLDGFDVVYEEDEGEVIGLGTYDMGIDNHGEEYMLMGVNVIDPEYAGEGVGDRLFARQLKIVKESGGSYITATADTTYGHDYLDRIGFELVDDDVTGREHYRYDVV